MFHGILIKKEIENQVSFFDFEEIYIRIRQILMRWNG